MQQSLSSKSSNDIVAHTYAAPSRALDGGWECIDPRNPRGGIEPTGLGTYYTHRKNFVASENPSDSGIVFTPASAQGLPSQSACYGGGEKKEKRILVVRFREPIFRLCWDGKIGGAL